MCKMDLQGEKMKKLKVGIIGATGMVGQRFIQLLENHPWFDVEILAASSRSKGKSYEEAVKWKMDSNIPENIKSKIIMDSVSDCEEICSSVDFVFCAVNMEKDQLQKLEYLYAQNECPVVSNNSAHRWTPDVPIVIPEVNPDHIKIIDQQRKRLGTNKGFISAKPNCSIQCFVPPLFPLLKFGIDSIIVSTYQAISGAGKTFDDFPEIEDNIIPYISGEDEKTETEPLKILGSLGPEGIIPNGSIRIVANCVRVPVSDGHLASVFVKFRDEVSEDVILDIWNNFNPLTLPSSPKQLIKYFYENDRPQVKLDRNLENGMGFNVGRLKKISKNEIKFVCMSHNTIRGAAGGAILFSELLYERGYLWK